MVKIQWRYREKLPQPSVFGQILFLFVLRDLFKEQFCVSIFTVQGC